MSAKATGGALLLVEDDDSIGRLVKQYLEQQDGWHVVWRRTGEEALAELRGQPVRFVVLDIGLPGIDGFEVCRRIRAGSKVPIVMLTARDEEPDRVAGLELGADDYVSKPFSPRELSARIKAILRRAERGTEALVRPLMLVHELANRVVLGLGGGEIDAAVVGQREQDRRAGGVTAGDKGLQPLFRHEIEQRRRRHERSPREQLLVEHRLPQIDAL